LPILILFNHRIQDADEFSHRGNQRNHFTFSLAEHPEMGFTEQTQIDLSQVRTNF
jgi:hypothetical protein